MTADVYFAITDPNGDGSVPDYLVRVDGHPDGGSASAVIVRPDLSATAVANVPQGMDARYAVKQAFPNAGQIEVITFSSWAARIAGLVATP